MPPIGWNNKWADHFSPGFAIGPYVWGGMGCRVLCYEHGSTCHFFVYSNGYVTVCHSGTRHNGLYGSLTLRSKLAACASDIRAHVDSFGNSVPVIARMGPLSGGLTGYSYGRYLPAGTLQLRRWSGGSSTVLASTPNCWGCNAVFYNLEVIGSGASTRVRAYICHSSPRQETWAESSLLMCALDTSPLPPGKVGLHAYCTYGPAATYLFQWVLEGLDVGPGCAVACGRHTACVTGVIGGRCWCYRALLPYRIYDRPIMNNLQELANGRFLLPYLVYDRAVQANMVAIARGILEHKRKGEVVLPYRVLGCQGNIQADFNALVDAFPE